MRTYFQKTITHLPLLLLATSLFCFGFTVGTVNEKLTKSSKASDLTFRDDIAEEIPLIEFKKIENGVLFGKMRGEEARIVLQDEEVHPLANGEFSFSVLEILPNLKIIPAPSGMKFVASKRGKTFWPLDAPEANLIPSKNRIFFENEAEATKKGFKSGK